MGHRREPDATGESCATAIGELRAVRVGELRVLEAAPDAMIIVDATSRIAMVNRRAERLFGYPHDELVGQVVDVILPDKLRSGGLDLFGRRKDGSEFPAEINLSPMDDERGRLTIAAIRDITARLAAEKSLALANRELEAFSYSVAHDLRAPLRSMAGFAQLVLDGHRSKLDGEACEWLGEILAGARRMAGLIDALLSLSRVARIELHREWTDLSAIARGAARQRATAEPGRSVELTIADGLGADVDPELARMAFDHLLDNAWKFTGKLARARIEVGVTEHAGTRAFFVRDNGAGFDMAFANKLFVPFQRLHTVGEFTGTGVGLASVHRIVLRHGGEIWADGRIDGGATVYFTFARRGGP